MFSPGLAMHLWNVWLGKGYMYFILSFGIIKEAHKTWQTAWLEITKQVYRSIVPLI